MFVFFLSPNSGRVFETLFTLRFPLAGRGERSPEIRPHELIYKNTHAVTTVHHFPTRRSAGRFPALGEGEGGGGRGGGGSRARKRRRRPRTPLCSSLSPPGVPISHPHTNLQRDRGIILLLPSNGYSETIDDDQNYFCSRKRLIT